MLPFQTRESLPTLLYWVNALDFVCLELCIVQRLQSKLGKSKPCKCAKLWLVTQLDDCAVQEAARRLSSAPLL